MSHANSRIGNNIGNAQDQQRDKRNRHGFQSHIFERLLPGPARSTAVRSGAGIATPQMRAVHVSGDRPAFTIAYESGCYSAGSPCNQANEAAVIAPPMSLHAKKGIRYLDLETKEKLEIDFWRN